MTNGAPLLLVGDRATALAPRLEASGYRCSVLAPEVAATASLVEPPALILLATAGASGASASGTADAARALLAVLRRRWPEAPVLLDIGRDSVAARSACLSSGADDFWLSGHGASDLLTRIRLHLNLAGPRARAHAGRPEAAAPLQHADLSLDPARQQARRGGRPLQLTAREFALLALLLRHRGAVVSREQILAAVWPDQEPGASNVIEVYVRYLRLKLEAGGERRLIHTVRGRGYCLGDRPPPGPPHPPPPPTTPLQPPP